MSDPDVSFTNNTGEQKIRMSKVKIKVSGCFRTEFYAQAWCLISSYLDSAKALGYNPHVAIQIALDGNAVDMLKEYEQAAKRDYATSCLDFFNHEFVIAGTDLRSGTRCPLDDGDPLTNEVGSLGVGWLGCTVPVGYPDADRSASGTV